MTPARHPPSPVVLAAQLRREQLARRLDHQRRCRTMPPPDGAEISRMVADFAARGGQVTRCPTAYVVPVQNNTGPAPVPAMVPTVVATVVVPLGPDPAPASPSAADQADVSSHREAA